MKHVATEIVSRGTVASGRAMLTLSVAVILVHYLTIDIGQLQLLDIDLTEPQIAAASLWILALLTAIHLVNRFSHFAAMGTWNTCLKDAGGETRIGGGGKSKPRIEFIIERIEGQIDKLDKTADLSAPTGPAGKIADKLEQILSELTRLNAWRRRHERLAFAYIVGLHLMVPVAATLWATCILWKS